MMAGKKLEPQRAQRITGEYQQGRRLLNFPYACLRSLRLRVLLADEEGARS